MNGLGFWQELRIQRFLSLLVLLIALGVTFFAYRPGLTGPFVFDDGPNIVRNNAIQLSKLNISSIKHAAFSTDSGPLYRPISMVSFALNYYFTGLNSIPFKLTNLIIHLINGVGIFIVTVLLLNYCRQSIQPALSQAHVNWIGVATASAWLLHPFNLTGVLYVVQRMTSLSALFCIYGLALFVWGRIRLFNGKSGFHAILASLLVFTTLAALCKETGALLPLFMLVMEFTLFDFRTGNAATRRGLFAFYALSVGVPAITAVLYTAIHPEWVMSNYSIRDFDLPQRLMTETRVLWFYLKEIVAPNNSAMGLFHDDFGVSRNLVQPLATLPALVGILVLPVAAIIYRKRVPILAFGILFYLAGQLLESTIFPLELVFEHRNYLPMFGIVLAAFYYLLHPGYSRTLLVRSGLALMIISLFAFDTYARATQWADPFDFHKWEVLHHPNSARANDSMGDVFSSIRTPNKASLKKNAQTAALFYERATELDPNFTIGLFGLVTLGSEGRIKVDPSWLVELTRRLAHAPYASDIGQHLASLVTCKIRNVCELTPKDFNELFSAALSNPTCTGMNRAMVYSAQSYYLVNVAKDYMGGLAALKRMVAFSPSVLIDRRVLLQDRLTLVGYLIAIHRPGEAKDQLEIVEKMDTEHQFEKQIRLYKKEFSDRN